MKNRMLCMLLMMLLILPVTASEAGAQAVQENSDLPEWFLAPPQDYMKDGLQHYLVASIGDTHERALINAITDMASKTQKIDDRESSYQAPYFVSGSEITFEATLDSIEVSGKQSLLEAEHETVEDDYSSEFHMLYELDYKNGNDRYFIEVEAKETSTGKETHFTQTFSFHETNYGLYKFRSYLKNSPQWNIKEKEVIDERHYLLLEFQVEEEKQEAGQ